MLVPEAYKNQPALDDKPEITAFYDYYSGLQESWDGPALLVWSDGRKVGAALCVGVMWGMGGGVRVWVSDTHTITHTHTHILCRLARRWTAMACALLASLPRPTGSCA
jgi:glutamate synthase domain-containing protein 1